MTNNDNFDEVETLDAEMEEETPAAAPKPVKKSGGGAGKFIVLLAVLGIGGALGAEYMGLIKLPVDIPGVTPAAKVAVNTDAPPAATPATDAGLPAPADLAQGGLPPATGLDAVPPAIGTPPAPDTAAAPAVTPPSSPDMIPGAVGTQQADTTKIVAPGNADPFADLPPATGTAGDATASGKPTITPPAGITAPAGISAPDAISAPAPDALATAPDTAAAPPATDVTAAVSGNDPLAAAASDPMATPALDPMATTTPATTDPASTNPVVAADPAPVGADPETQGKLESLQTQVTTLEQNAASLKAEADAKDAEIAKLKADLAAAKSASSASSSAASAGDEPVVTAPKKRRVRAASSNTASPVVSSKVTSRWVLKSAKPGMAWVAPPGSNELKSIAVGDTLNGVGRVTAIAKDEAGRWYVSGTRGRIRQ